MEKIIFCEIDLFKEIKTLMKMLQEIKEFDKCTVNIPHVHFLN